MMTTKMVVDTQRWQRRQGGNILFPPLLSSLWMNFEEKGGNDRYNSVKIVMSVVEMNRLLLYVKEE